MPQTAETNPLLDREFRIPFDRIKAEHAEPAVDELLRDARERLAKLAADPSERTFDNTLLALEDITEKLDYAMEIVGHLESVATTPELRAAYNAVQPPVSEFYSSIPLNEDLWKQLKRYAGTAEAKQLTGSRARFLTKTLDQFRRSGADLDAAGKQRLAEINVELTKKTTKFSENVLDATNDFELIIEDESKLAGLPASAIDAARKSAEQKGKKGWRFTLQAPSYIAVMTYLDDPGIREKIYRAFSTRASDGKFDNRENIKDILALRREKAELLGYSNFADWVLEDRMAKRGEGAQSFVHSLKAKTDAAFAAENAGLLAFRKTLEGDDASDLAGWDVAYYSEKMRQVEYNFDEEELRPYFPFDSVVDGMFEVVKRLYDIDVKQEADMPAWDRDVRYYSIYDSDKKWLGSFYADFFPRENKRGGAWMDSLLTSSPTDSIQQHLGLICGNLTPSIGAKPALLTHREVETVFHEFGHLLHHLLSTVEIRSLAGTSVAWDFVELPSQIMENWCWEREALDLFARHYETGQPIPEELFGKMKKARTFRGANMQMRQLSFGTVDLALHIDYDPEKTPDVMEFGFEILQSFSPVKLPPGHAMLAGFTHLFASPVGYGAGYYSYKWSEVLDADAFTRFAQEGIFSREVGLQFRGQILAKGNSEPPDDLFRRFMGRDPNPEALLDRLGLASV